MAAVGALVDLPGWLGVNIAWFAFAGAAIGHKYADASTLGGSLDD
jgi:hypothetical protein